MNDVNGAAGRGAVDLSAMAAPGAAQPGAVPSHAAAVPAQAQQVPGAESQAFDPMAPTVDAPLITEVTEATFDDVMALSQSVPVVLVLYAPNSLTSKQAVDVLEDVARRAQGAFQLGKVNVDANPTLASAFQIQNIPAGVAILARRPVPLFEGVPTETQIEQVLAELFQVAPQLGVVGRLNVSDEDLEKPTPPEHLPAREAEDRGDWDAAIAAWKKVLASNPGDQEAKTALVRAQFESRQDAVYNQSADEEQEQDLESRADALFARGEEGAAFGLLLDGIGRAQDAQQRDALRSRLVELFQIAADKSAVKTARSRLATMLMV